MVHVSGREQFASLLGVHLAVAGPRGNSTFWGAARLFQSGCTISHELTGLKDLSAVGAMLWGREGCGVQGGGCCDAPWERWGGLEVRIWAFHRRAGQRWDKEESGRPRAGRGTRPVDRSVSVRNSGAETPAVQTEAGGESGAQQGREEQTISAGGFARASGGATAPGAPALVGPGSSPCPCGQLQVPVRLGHTHPLSSVPSSPSTRPRTPTTTGTCW